MIVDGPVGKPRGQTDVVDQTGGTGIVVGVVEARKADGTRLCAGDWVKNGRDELGVAGLGSSMCQRRDIGMGQGNALA